MGLKEETNGRDSPERSRELEQNIPLHQPVLLLMDIFLGGYDGRKICRRLKDSHLFDQLSVVLFSAQTYSKESAVESGADAVLNKPFSLKTLYGVIDNMLSKQH
ncbi:PleD family two-component system response regulator [Chitinophaga sp. YR627]|uniref:response regulator n=1 Tax=Chitinophaga sp. YR627 TaxID=1881041 RepID=UPI000B7FAC9A|nr:response regulator [Chitinophaga sp. YR627]